MFGLAEDLLITPLKKKIRVEVMALTIRSFTVLLQSSRTSVPYKGMPTGRWWRMDNDDLEAVSKLEEVEYTSGVIWGNELHCSYKERKGDYQMMGYTPD